MSERADRDTPTTAHEGPNNPNLSRSRSAAAVRGQYHLHLVRLNEAHRLVTDLTALLGASGATCKLFSITMDYAFLWKLWGLLLWAFFTRLIGLVLSK